MAESSAMGLRMFPEIISSHRQLVEEFFGNEPTIWMRYWQQHITEVRTRISHAEWNKYKYLLGWIYPNLNSDSFWGFVDDHVMTERKFHDTIKNRRKTSNHKKNSTVCIHKGRNYVTLTKHLINPFFKRILYLTIKFQQMMQLIIFIQIANSNSQYNDVPVSFILTPHSYSFRLRLLLLLLLFVSVS